ncbi:MAG: UDP-N-acetylmuramate dehydrogenase [Lachnospiraceae bacterium]|nr:UDP-N-acetylmuramate dehydrogenase [Lachnospiraceae bacterium]
MSGNIFETISYTKEEPLKKHTTFRIGGAAKYFFTPKNSTEIYDIICYCRENHMPYYILGNGSNVLFSDDGYDGAVINIYNSMNDISVTGESIYAMAGALLSKIAVTAKDNELHGMEFAAGIPGTIGGAMVMNAGAYGGEMRDIVSYVDILDIDGNIRKYSCEEMCFGYRKSIVSSDMVVVGAELKLQKGDRMEIETEMERLKQLRVSKQPLEYPSAGSTFKRPEGYFAGKLIEDTGLKGYRVGDAMVSEKHCGFVINCGNATCNDVKALIGDVQDKVYEKFGVQLMPEVKIVG